MASYIQVTDHDIFDYLQTEVEQNLDIFYNLLQKQNQPKPNNYSEKQISKFRIIQDDTFLDDLDQTQVKSFSQDSHNISQSEIASIRINFQKINKRKQSIEQQVNNVQQEALQTQNQINQIEKEIQNQQNNLQNIDNEIDNQQMFMQILQDQINIKVDSLFF